MTLYVITYDLRQPGRNYGPLHAAIRSLGDYIHPLDSVWYVTSNASAIAIRDVLMKHVDANDRLVVQRCAADVAAYNMDPVSWQWLEPRVSTAK